MNAPLTSRRLRGAQTIDYFLHCLQNGGATDAGLNRAVLAKGGFSVIVPHGASAQRVAEFASGGLLPAVPEGTAPVTLQPTPTTVPALSALVLERLQRYRDPVLWVHEPVLSEQEVTMRGARSERLDGQLYLAYEDDFRTRERIAEIVRYSSLSWHFLAFLTDRTQRPGSISGLVAHARMILVGAYDGESFLLWERT